MDASPIGLGYVGERLSRIEQDPAVADRFTAFAALRTLGLDAFGLVLLRMPHPNYPKLSRLLPAMASHEAQLGWTGDHGVSLLRQSCAVVRPLVSNYPRITGRDLGGASILDYGCGYGRLARLMYYFSDRVVGVDPWSRSIEECEKAGLGDQFLLSDYLPSQLPTDQIFDLAFAFSVFTHTSERATVAALSAVRRSMAPGGLFCITIRPPEYWDNPPEPAAKARKEELRRRHDDQGFAFMPHNFAQVEGEALYGDTSMSLDWIRDHAEGWSIRGIDYCLEDPWQIYVLMTPVP